MSENDHAEDRDSIGHRLVDRIDNKRVSGDRARFFQSVLDDADDVAEEMTSHPQVSIDLSRENVREIRAEFSEIRRPWVRIWLHDCTVGVCEERTVYPFSVNSHNGKVRYVLDIREF